MIYPRTCGAYKVEFVTATIHST